MSSASERSASPKKPEFAPLDELAKQFGFEPPRHKGMNVVAAFEAMVQGKVNAVINLGGNLVRSVPDTAQIEPAWRKLGLTVNVATKLNRSHLLPGRVSYVLPCLSRIEFHREAGGPQAVSMEDSTGCMHGSRGVTEPAGENIRSEPSIVAEIAKATLGARSTVDWTAWRDDYSLVRDEIAKTYSEISSAPRQGLERSRMTKTGFLTHSALQSREILGSAGVNI